MIPFFYYIEYQNLWIKQIIWYGIGIFLAYSTMALGNNFLYNNAWIFYIIGVLSLILVLFFGIEINKQALEIAKLTLKENNFLKLTHQKEKT